MSRLLTLEGEHDLPLVGVRFDIQPMPQAAINVTDEDGRRVALRILAPFTVEGPLGSHAINEDPKTFRHVLPISGKRIVRARAIADGSLILDVEDQIRVSIPGGRLELWQVEVDGTVWASQPGRGTALWRPDVDAPESGDDVALTYLRYHRTKADDDAWAWEVMDSDILIGDGEEQWPHIVELVRLAVDEGELMYIAAGPLEELLNHHGPRFIDRIEAEASWDPKFLRAVAGVWLRPRRGPVWGRIQSVLARR